MYFILNSDLVSFHEFTLQAGMTQKSVIHLSKCANISPCTRTVSFIRACQLFVVVDIHHSRTPLPTRLGCQSPGVLRFRSRV